MNRTIFGFLLATLCVIAIGACTKGVGSGAMSTRGKVAVISFLGHQFNALENGRPRIDLVEENFNTSANVRSMLFDKEKFARILGASPMIRWDHEIDDWGIDKTVISTAEALIAPGHQVVPFAYDPASFKEVGIVHFLDEEKTAAHVADVIRAQPNYSTAKDIDAFIVIVPAGRELTAGFARPSYGVGITKDFQAYHELSATFEDVYMLHAFFYVMVLDGRSLTQLAGTAGHHETLYQKRFKGFPGLFVDAGLWAPNYEALTTSQRQEIAREVEEMIRATMPGTFVELGLTH